MTKKRELFYIIALVLSLLTNVGLFLLPHAASEPITYETIGSPTEATITESTTEATQVSEQNESIPSPSPQPTSTTTQNATKASKKGTNPTPPSKITANEPKININTATTNQLTRLPHIGESTAKKIIDYRTSKGDFNRIQDIMLVKGIGEKSFADMKDFITVE